MRFKMISNDKLKNSVYRILTASCIPVYLTIPAYDFVNKVDKREMNKAMGML
jgi:hypothetical protein